MRDEVAERLLPLEGGVNFRDMGGYATADGRRVKWRHLYRSGTLGRLTEADYGELADRGITTVIDLRTGSEQLSDRNRWCDEAGVGYWSRQHEEVFGHLHEMLESGIASEAEAVEVMEGGFRLLPFQQAEAYGELFGRLAQGHAPLVFNCTAGKDRTGGAAALVLSALGVPRDSVIADFTLTEHCLDLRKTFHSRKDDPNVQRFLALGEGVLSAIGGARPGYITAFLDAIDEQCGSLAGYLRDLGYSQGDVAMIRDHLLE